MTLFVRAYECEFTRMCEHSCAYVCVYVCTCKRVGVCLHSCLYHPRAPGVAAADYVSTRSSLPLAHPCHKLLF